MVFNVTTIFVKIITNIYLQVQWFIAMLDTSFHSKLKINRNMLPPPNNSDAGYLALLQVKN